MGTFSLADIQDAAEAKFGDMRLEIAAGREVVLRNALRMPKAERRELTALQKRLDTLQSDDEEVAASELGEDEDQAEGMARLVRDMLALIASEKAAATELLAKVGDDLPLLMQIITEYGQVAQPGEASPSPS